MMNVVWWILLGIYIIGVVILSSLSDVFGGKTKWARVVVWPFALLWAGAKALFDRIRQ